jgi:kinesin family protein 5
VFQPLTQQCEFYKESAAHIVQDVLNGYNGTILAYGQTGSGKTYSMMGELTNPDLQGITPRIVYSIFQTIMSAPSNLEFTVKVSFMEIYMERIRDLLSPNNDNLPIHEDKMRGVYVRDLTESFVGSASEVFSIMQEGLKARAVSSTSMNDESSRSHALFNIVVSQKNLDSGIVKNGKLALVDLAGSEKVAKTGATGQTLEEAKKINKSLSALGNVINSLTDGKV